MVPIEGRLKTASLIFFTRAIIILRVFVTDLRIGFLTFLLLETLATCCGLVETHSCIRLASVHGGHTFQLALASVKICGELCGCPSTSISYCRW